MFNMFKKKKRPDCKPSSGNHNVPDLSETAINTRIAEMEEVTLDSPPSGKEYINPGRYVVLDTSELLFSVHEITVSYFKHKILLKLDNLVPLRIDFLKTRNGNFMEVHRDCRSGDIWYRAECSEAEVKEKYFRYLKNELMECQEENPYRIIVDNYHAQEEEI